MGAVEVEGVEQIVGGEVRGEGERKAELGGEARAKSLEPRSQIGMSSPSPGTARTAWPGTAGRK